MSDYQNYENSLLILDKIFGTTKNVPSYPTYLPENKESLYTSLCTSGLTPIKSCNYLKTDSSLIPRSYCPSYKLLGFSIIN